MKMTTHKQLYLDTEGRDWSPSTRAVYKMCLDMFERFFGDRDLATLDSNAMSDWVRWMADIRQNSTNTIYKYRFRTVKRFLRWGIETQGLPESLMKIFDRRKLPKLPVQPITRHAMSEEQHEALLRAARSGATKYWWATACMMAWHLGLRCSDIAFAKWANIDWEAEVYSATPIKTKRFGKRVRIPMDAELVDWLYALREKPYYVSEYIIPDMAAYYQATHENLTRMFRALADRAGVSREVSFHSYRHAFVSRLLNAGVEPLVIASMTGQSLAQIVAYAHISETAQREALTKARNLLVRERLCRRGITKGAAYEPAREAPVEAIAAHAQ